MQIAAPGLWLREVPGWSRGRVCGQWMMRATLSQKRFDPGRRVCQPCIMKKQRKRRGWKVIGMAFTLGSGVMCKPGSQTLVLAWKRKTTRNCWKKRWERTSHQIHGWCLGGTDARVNFPSLRADDDPAGKEAEPFREVTISATF